jgi:protein-tyrosine-phosphatase
VARTILVVCTANQCRSPMATGLIRARLAAEGRDRDVEVRSAGTWAAEGAPATDHALAVLAERGIDFRDHRSAEIGAADVEDADLILVMTESHRVAIEAEFPSARGKVRLASQLAGGRWDTADPVGGTLEDYRATADELARLIADGWPEIVGPSG